MCERNNDGCSGCSGCCSECDFDEYVDNGTDTTFGSDDDFIDVEKVNTRDDTDTREMTKLQDIKYIKENCGHYISGCKIIAKCCNTEFGCRLCHDSEISDHEINRYEIEEIICNNCKLRQSVSNSCINTECSVFGGNFASYYCDICHLYSDKPVSEIYNLIRGLSPYPAAFSFLEGNKVKIFKTEIMNTLPTVAAGEFETDKKTFLYFAGSDGYIALLELQLEGKKKMEIADFLRGYRWA